MFKFSWQTIVVWRIIIIKYNQTCEKNVKVIYFLQFDIYNFKIQLLYKTKAFIYNFLIFKNKLRLKFEKSNYKINFNRNKLGN